MTIITKPISEKKAEKLSVPLVENDQLASAPPDDVESQSIGPARFVQLNVRARRLSALTTACLLMLAFLVVGIGMLCGTYLYRQYVQTRVHRFRGWCNIPYDPEAINQNMLTVAAPLGGGDVDKTEEEDRAEFDRRISNFFQEGFELDLDNELFEKIDVPDFRDGRTGRFIHDFNNNLTGIVDSTGGRCFVMPLDRSKVLPPRDMYDLIIKMWNGYYKVDTMVIKQSMRVVVPPISDANVGQYIAQECKNMTIYRLEKYVGGVVKRSADLHVEAKFAQFSGKGITEVDIVNLEDIAAFEKAKLQ